LVVHVSAFEHPLLWAKKQKRKLYETKSSTIKNEHDKNAIISYALLLLQHYGFRAEHDPRN
jgi:hypothetical protein